MQDRVPAGSTWNDEYFPQWSRPAVEKSTAAAIFHTERNGYSLRNNRILTANNFACEREKELASPGVIIFRARKSDRATLSPRTISFSYANLIKGNISRFLAGEISRRKWTARGDFRHTGPESFPRILFRARGSPWNTRPNLRWPPRINNFACSRERRENRRTKRTLSEL